eukprot:COSAG02_NODE_17890_length_973_cov_1.229977_1_plen_137_part_00
MRLEFPRRRAVEAMPAIFQWIFRTRLCQSRGLRIQTPAALRAPGIAPGGRPRFTPTVTAFERGAGWRTVLRRTMMGQRVRSQGARRGAWRRRPTPVSDDDGGGGGGGIALPGCLFLAACLPLPVSLGVCERVCVIE